MALWNRNKTSDAAPKPLTDIEKYQQTKAQWEAAKRGEKAKTTQAAVAEAEPQAPAPAEAVKQVAPAPDTNSPDIMETAVPINVDLQNLIESKLEVPVHVDPAKGADGKEVPNVWEIRIPIQAVKGADGNPDASAEIKAKLSEIFNTADFKALNARIRSGTKGSSLPHIYKMNMSTHRMNEIIAFAVLNELLPDSSGPTKPQSPDDSFEGITVVPKETAVPTSLPPSPMVTRWKVSGADVKKLKVFAEKEKESAGKGLRLNFDSWYDNQINKTKVNEAFYGGPVPNGASRITITKTGADYHIDNVPDSAKQADLFVGEVKVETSSVPRKSVGVAS